MFDILPALMLELAVAGRHEGMALNPVVCFEYIPHHGIQFLQAGAGCHGNLAQDYFCGFVG